METYRSVNSLVSELSPEQPLHIFRPHAIKRAVRFFTRKFGGDVLYAIKTNPEPHVLKELWKHGIRHFDAASLHEVELARGMFAKAEIHFMHTVKSRHAIREAYFTHGVKDFSLDSLEELSKICKETKNAKDLGLYIRLAIPNTYAEINLSDKFGINLHDAVNLLKTARKKAARLGVCFHVGSQCMHPNAYRIAMNMAADVIKKAKVKIDMMDVGGGFPSIYPGMKPPALEDYMDAIHEEFKRMKLKGKVRLMCEPGRALVAESGSVLVRVDLRKDHNLYINDGTYGSLFDAGYPGFIFPTRLRRPGEDHSENSAPFSFYGPTCDTLDFMKGPFFLPEDTEEGDYIEIGQLGAYGRTFATRFNGFFPASELAVVEDDPLMSMYDGADESEPLDVVAA